MALPCVAKHRRGCCAVPNLREQRSRESAESRENIWQNGYVLALAVPFVLKQRCGFGHRIVNQAAVLV